MIAVIAPFIHFTFTLMQGQKLCRGCSAIGTSSKPLIRSHSAALLIHKF